MAPSEQSIRDAALVALRFWTAIGKGDSAALDDLLSDYWARRPDDFAELYLTERQLAPEAAALMGMASFVDVLTDDRLRFWFRPTDRPEHLEAGVPAVMWRLEVVHENGAWRVGKSSDLMAVEQLTVPGFEGPGEPTTAPRLN